MTTTVSVSSKGRMALPKAFVKRRKIKMGTALRVTEVADGLYITPIPAPTARELRNVIAAAGSLIEPQTPKEEEDVRRTIEQYRQEARRKR